MIIKFDQYILNYLSNDNSLMYVDPGHYHACFINYCRVHERLQVLYSSRDGSTMIVSYLVIGCRFIYLYGRVDLDYR